MGFVILDPTAPPWKPSEECALGFLTVGADSDRLLIVALAKASLARDHGLSAGAVLYSQPHRVADGYFRWGHTANVEGTIVGGSGLTEVQDRFEAQMVAAEFNYQIARARELWLEANPGRPWLCSDGPGERFTRAMEDYGK
jgi:hypothetical protein